MDTSETVGAGPRGPPKYIHQGYERGSFDILNEHCSVIGERHDISDRVDRNAPVLDNLGMFVEKLTENIVDLKNVVQKLVEANQSIECKYQELVSALNNQTNMVNKVFYTVQSRLVGPGNCFKETNISQKV